MSNSKKSELPILMNIRTGLASKDDAILRYVGPEFAERSIADAINHLIDEDGLDDNEAPYATSVRQEVDAKECIIMANGRPAKIRERIGIYLQARKQDGVDYHGLDLVVSSVDEGGLR